MTAPRKREGMTAKTPAQRQAERRARGAKSVVLSGDVLALLDAVAAHMADGTRVACIARLVRVEQASLSSRGRMGS